jgi:hypothetical protein
MNKSHNCINCGAPLPDRPDKKCLYCGSVNFSRDDVKPWHYFLRSQKVRTHAIYPILLIIGIALVVYIYGIAFDSFSETMLIRITPLWFFPIVFGGFGFAAEKMLGYVASGEAVSIAEAYKKWMNVFISRHILVGFILMFFLFPFSFFSSRNALLIAFFGSVVWGVLLLVFFNGIFPSL